MHNTILFYLWKIVFEFYLFVLFLGLSSNYSLLFVVDL